MRLKFIFVLVIIIWHGIAVAEQSLSRSNIVEADQICAKIELGEPVIYDNVIIEGDIHLSRQDPSKERPVNKNKGPQSNDRGKTSIFVASPIRITNSVIKGNANFDYANFQEPISFEGTNFTNGVSFREARFEENADIAKTEHGGYVNFWLAEFMKDANFDNVLFKGYTDFRCVNFNGSASFSGSQFYKEATFYKAYFISQTTFNTVRFFRVANFGNVLFDDVADFEYSLFNGYSDFRFARFSKDASFRGAQFNGSADFRDSQFKGEAEFQETGYRTDFDIRGIRFSTLKIEWPSIENFLISDGPVYLQLIKNLKNLEQFDDANECYLKYRIYSMNKRSWSDERKYLDVLGWSSCGFGVRPDFTIVWMLISIILFAILYWAIDIFQEQPYPFSQKSYKNSRNFTIVDAAMEIFKEQTHPLAQNPTKKTRCTSIIDATIFSAALFFTLPPPLDFIKSRHFRVLYVLEDIIGWLLMALFLVTLLNVMMNS